MAAATMLVLTTCGSPESADRLAAALVGERLAACVNRIDNVLSTYRWQDAIQSDRETLLLIKTTEERLADVENAIRARSDYELPECIAVRIDAGSPAYLNWLAAAAAG